MREKIAFTVDFAPILATLALKLTIIYGKGQTHALLLMTTCNLGSVCVGVVWNSWNGMCHLVPLGSEYRAHMSDHWLGNRTLVQNMHIFRLFLDGYIWFSRFELHTHYWNSCHLVSFNNTQNLSRVVTKLYKVYRTCMRCLRITKKASELRIWNSRQICKDADIAIL